MPPGKFSKMVNAPGYIGKCRHGRDPKQDGMRDPPVSQQIISFIQPEIGNEIDIRKALGKRTEQHSLSPQYFACCGFTDTGAENDMCYSIQVGYVLQ